MKKIFQMFMIVCVLTTCKKEEEFNADCFINEVSDPLIINYNGCGTMYLSISDHQLISVYLNETTLGLSKRCKVIDISQHLNDVDITYSTYSPHPDSIYLNNCSDIAFPQNLYGKLTNWKAVSGYVITAISKEKYQRHKCEPFMQSITLSNVRFIKENSTEDTVISKLVKKNGAQLTCIP